MQKDVIYIDVEDDITAIIGKVKGAKEKIVALVPPKRIGVLQSAVNLRLLARAADGVDKRLVIITGNVALGSLAASAKIPVAKTLQSKPELAELPQKKNDDDDIIDGEKLPVGEHAGIDDDDTIIGKVPPSKIDDLDIDGEKSTPSKAATDRKAGAKRGIKVPDFGTFRKKMFFLVGGGILLLAFLIWAIWFAPHATIVISAKTTDQELSVPVTVGPDIETDSDQAHIKSVLQQEKATQTVDFEATGTKDVGEKATGTVTLSTNDFSLIASGTSVPAGTQLSTPGGLIFTTTQSVSFALQPGGNQRTTGIVAAGSGTQYNGFTGNLAGAPSGVSAKVTDGTSGGTEKKVKIVLQADVEKAKAQLAEQNADAEKKKLAGKFDKEVIIIDSSFKATGGDPQSSPAIGQESTDGKAKLTQETTYMMSGVDKSQMKSYLDQALKGTLTNADEQKIYDNGISTVKFADFAQNEGSQAGTANLAATAQIGPKIDDGEIKELVKGKRSGEILGDLKSIDGVNDVEVKLSPFWVQSVPGDIKKITVDFKLQK